jgi:hypothetical protein
MFGHLLTRVVIILLQYNEVFSTERSHGKLYKTVTTVNCCRTVQVLVTFDNLF